MSINVILATDQLGAIGLNGTLPWPQLKEDMKGFKETTSGHIVVMGRKTWDDPKMPKPLPDRINLVATSKILPHPGVTAIKDVQVRLRKIQQEYPDKEVFIIGGKALIESCISFVDKVYLTHIRGSFKADTFIDMRWLLKDFRIITAVPGEVCMFSIHKRDKNYSEAIS